MKMIGALAAVLAGLAWPLSSTDGAEFTKKPTAQRTADGVRIDFTVSAATDVAVFIEDANGQIVRHLVAGVLGKNAPAPLKADSLEQSIPWDGKADYGKPAGAGPFKVRVALGLGAGFDKVLVSDPQNLGNIQCVAVGPDGTVYVTTGAGGTGPVWSGQVMVALDRQGKYVRQLMPFPADLTMEQAAGFDVVELNGRPAPLVHEIQARSFYASTMPRKAGMAVTPDGVVLTMVGPCNLGALDSRGAAVWGKYVGPSLQPKEARPRLTGRPFVAVASDGKSAFVSGLVRQVLDEKKSPVSTPLTAVYRVKLPDRSPAEPFFGDPTARGEDTSHLGGAPRGLAVDGKGHLLICDYVNKRVLVVGERDGKFVSQFAVEPPAGKPDDPAAGKKPRVSDTDSGPDCVAVDPNTGAVYVSRLTGGGNAELIKYSGIAEPKVVARLPVAKSGNPDCPWVMALDAGAAPPVLWLGGDGGNLLRIEDLGDKFSPPRDVITRTIGNGSFVDISVDRARKEIYSRISLGPYIWLRFNEQTEEFARVNPGPYPGAAGSQLVAGPDGFLYSPAYSKWLLKFDRAGKPVSWQSGEKVETVRAEQPANALEVPVSMTFLTHTVGIRHDGQIFMFDPGKPGGRPPKMLVQIDPTTGKRVGEPIIWKVSDTAVGPKFDPQGNIYIAEQVRPVDQPYPPEFASLVGKVELEKTYLEGLKDAIPSMYGSIVKFSPKGGMIHFDGPNPFEGQPKLDPALETVNAATYHGHRNKPIKVTGAMWMHMGVSHVDLIACNCENTRFDVDEFGRVFYPDMGRFRVGVLDTNGNLITEFGQYGNADTRDALAFSWLVGVGATDRYAYMGDSLNRRLLRAKLTYRAEESCTIGP